MTEKEPIKVTHRKLGRYNADGLAWTEGQHIEIDSRLQGKAHLEIMLHEMLHVLNPKWSELKVIHQSRKMAEVLWEQRYRRVEL